MVVFVPNESILTPQCLHKHIYSKIQTTEEAVKMCPDITDRLRVLEQEVGRYREESRKSQAEVERLMGALKDAEMDKSCKEKKISDLERWGFKEFSQFHNKSEIVCS